MSTNKLSERKDFYKVDGDTERTKRRLDEIQDMGLTEVATAEFGIDGVVSGLYAERIWSESDFEWAIHMEFIKSLIPKEQLSSNPTIHYCICMTCGIRNDAHNPDSFCRNGHDDWLELRDFSHMETGGVRKATKVFLMKRGELYEAFTDPTIKQLTPRQ